MTATNKLGLELLQNAAANQTLANTTFARLNQLVQAGVVDKDLAAPPASPADESLYIVAASATGAWAGRDGQLAYWLVTAGAWQFISPKEGFFLHVNDEDVFYKFTGTAWEVFSGGGGGGGMTNPMTAIRDLIVGGVGGAPARLPGPTSEGMVLTRIGNALAWAIATGFANPMTSAGDIIIGGTNGAATRLAGGADGRVLTMVAGAPAWVTPSGSGGDFKKDGSVQMTGAFNDAPAAFYPVTSADLDWSQVASTTAISPNDATTVSSMSGAPAGAKRMIRFGAGHTLVHSDNVLELPSLSNILTEFGDTASFLNRGNGRWQCTGYVRASGRALVASAGGSGDFKKDGSVQMSGAFNEAPAVEVSGGGGVANIGNKANTINFTFTGDVLGFYDPDGKIPQWAIRRFRFLNAGILRHQGTSDLTLIGNANITAAAGDTAVFQMTETAGFGKWQCLSYTRADGTALVTSAGFTEAQVRATPLNGLPATAGDVTETDSVLSGIGKLQASKVAKESGKGLSTNDYTTTEKNKLSGIADGAQVNSVTSVAGRTGAVTLAKADVGLANADNTADSAKPVSVAQQAALDLKAPIASPTFSNTARIYGPSGEPRFILDGPAGLNKYFTFYTAGVQRFQFGMSSAAESGGNAGSNFYINRFGDDGTSIGNVMTATRSSGEIVLWGPTQTTGPLRPGQYTLSTLPSAAAYNGYEIDVTNATVSPAGPKRCRSNGTNWLILNTNTPVS